MRLHEVRDALAIPVESLERLADDDLVALDERDLVSVPGERQRGRKARHAATEDDDRQRSLTVHPDLWACSPALGS
jgi:hypothetical protein